MNQSNLPVDLSASRVEILNDSFFQDRNLTVSVLRIDLIHPVISGNKWFKLNYSLEKAINDGKSGIITQGGAFSNHLLATACICKHYALKSVGIVRGERPETLSPTLSDLVDWGMELVFVSREDYSNKSRLLEIAGRDFPSFLWVDEGGRSTQGVQGAAEILSLVSSTDYSHIACAVGTGTMMAGLVNSSLPAQKIIGIPVLKLQNPSDNDILEFLQQQCKKSNFELLYQFHEGGYGKLNPGLIEFMNNLYRCHQLPTDRVYTSKLMKAVYQLAEDGYFPGGSRVLVIHSGGLQGNRSLPAGTLLF